MLVCVGRRAHQPFLFNPSTHQPHKGLVAYAALSFDAKGKRTLLAAFLLYHATIVLDAGYGYWLEGVVDELSCVCHTIMAGVIGLFLHLGTKRAHRLSPKKR